MHHQLSALPIETRLLCLAARMQRDAQAQEHMLALLGEFHDWEALWQLAHLHEVSSLVAYTLRPLAAQFGIPAAWQTRAQRRVLATLLRNTSLRDELGRVITALRQANIGVIPIKGVVLAETIYGELSVRPAADMDILVRPQDLPAARTVLYDLGYGHREELLFAERHHPYHDPQYFRRVDGNDLCLELHWALWADRYFHLDSAVLWERAVSGTLGGVPTSLLSPEDTLLHLAIHRSRSALRLRFLCDVAELLRVHGATLDWDYLLHQARVAGARTALFYALSLPSQLLDAPLPPDLLPKLKVNPLKQRVLENTCGITALFRPAQAGDVRQQPHLIYRIFEQDGAFQIAQALSYSLMRTGWKYVHLAKKRVRAKSV